MFLSYVEEIKYIMKIAIIGYSGSGKSTLAKRLSEKYNYHLLYLDTVNFEANWKERDKEEAKRMVEEFMKNDSWIIDGNYFDFYQDRRMKEAENIQIDIKTFAENMRIRLLFARAVMILKIKFNIIFLTS